MWNYCHSSISIFLDFLGLSDFFQLLILFSIGLLVAYYAYFGEKVSIPRFSHYTHFEQHDSQNIYSYEGKLWVAI